MNTEVMFGKASDEWATPQALFDALHEEFQFTVDAAATRDNAKLPNYIGPDSPFPDALDPLLHWGHGGSAFLNPPYSKCRAFIAKAAEEAAHNQCIVVAVVPSRTDTQWWHAYVWDATAHCCRPGVELRFLKGRLKFGESDNGAPFPSVVIVFRPVG